MNRVPFSHLGRNEDWKERMGWRVKIVHEYYFKLEMTMWSCARMAASKLYTEIQSLLGMLRCTLMVCAMNSPVLQILFAFKKMLTCDALGVDVGIDAR